MLLARLNMLRDEEHQGGIVLLHNGQPLPGRQTLQDAGIRDNDEVYYFWGEGGEAAATVEAEAPCKPKQETSKRQQKKQVLRDARQERKGEKKLQKQVEALEAALAALDGCLKEHLGDVGHDRADRATRDALLEAFGATGCRYQELPLVHGPCPAEGLRLLGSCLLRPQRYNAKFLPQEYSLLHKVWSLVGGDTKRCGVLDIGAGNANCAVLAAALLGLTVICVERESPRKELRAEEQLPTALKGKVIRIEADIADFDTAALASLACRHDLDRFVLLAKHPCGIGVDRSIEMAVQLRRSSRLPASEPQPPTLLGVVIATCCTNKLSLDDFRESRVEEFCAMYADPTGTRSKTLALVRAVEVMSRCSAWRSASASLGNAITSQQVSWAELFEDHLQSLRLKRLSTAFGASVEVRFAPRECTLQDRCLLAAESSVPEAIYASSDPAFLQQLTRGVRELSEAAGGPLDCRPKGLKSAKYDFDYTDD
ncbi:unnamed protein product [Symbiodinium necroappetens]|uniref:tRNA:m(4)X modification enzyme TRM13 n=1 Tax=Symbiodinium necroappetens TaxID=1628268 RepID=A0A812Z068_9DINO|nr:unnamed protein product [Symbiodinium necroappetens]